MTFNCSLDDDDNSEAIARAAGPLPKNEKNGDPSLLLFTALRGHWKFRLRKTRDDDDEKEETDDERVFLGTAVIAVFEKWSILEAAQLGMPF
jgi:hypothetical protein